MSAFRKTLLVLAAVLAVALVARCAQAQAPTSNAFAHRAPVWVVQFVVTENFRVETVTCTDYFSHTDFQDYGTITGKGCTSTGPLVDQVGTQGHVSVDLEPVLVAEDCRVDSAVLTPGFASVAINCISNP